MLGAPRLSADLSAPIATQHSELLAGGAGEVSAQNALTLKTPIARTTNHPTTEAANPPSGKGKRRRTELSHAAATAGANKGSTVPGLDEASLELAAMFCTPQSPPPMP